MARTEWRDAGTIRAVDAAGAVHEIRVRMQWIEVVMSGQPTRWQSAHRKRLIHASGEQMNPIDERTVELPSTGQRLTLV